MVLYPRSGLGRKIFVLGSIRFNRESIDNRFLHIVQTRLFLTKVNMTGFFSKSHIKEGNMQLYTLKDSRMHMLYQFQYETVILRINMKHCYRENISHSSPIFHNPCCFNLRKAVVSYFIMMTSDFGYG